MRQQAFPKRSRVPSRPPLTSSTTWTAALLGAAWPPPLAC